MTVLVIDIGSSSVRAMLFDDRARLLPDAMAARSHQFATQPPGAAYADTDHLRRLTEACIDQILEHPLAKSIEAVGLAGFTGSLLGVDRRGVPSTPVYTYADTRSQPDVDLLGARINREDVHQRTGCIHHVSYFPARFHWLRRTDPARFQAVWRWMDFCTYLYTLWFGDAPCSYSMASWTGMLDRAALAWDQAWLEVLDISPALLPQLADYDQMQVGLKPEYARRWPALRRTPFCLAVGDGAAANVGSGSVDQTTIALTVGTTAALRVILQGEPPPVPPGLWSYRLDARHHVLGGATSEGGNIFRWARSVLTLPDDATIEAELARRPPDAHGLTFLPLLSGERSPGWAGAAAGAVSGLRLGTQALDILQAALEGVALRLALINDQLRLLASDDAALMAGGGALAASPAWAQMIASAINRPLHLLAEAEITARGAAILALCALGRCGLSSFPPAVAHVVRPVPEQTMALRRALKRQVALYQKLVTGQPLTEAI